MNANLCVDSHLRELVESGFHVHVATDATGAPGQEAYDANNKFWICCRSHHEYSKSS